MYERLEEISRRLDFRGVRHNSNYNEMLQRLAPQAPLRELRTLADAVEPLGIDGREVTQVYSHFTPLNRLVDAARGESLPLRSLERTVQRLLASWPPDAELEREVREVLTAWRENHARLDRFLARSFLLKETIALSEDLSTLGAIGLQALDYIHASQTAPDAWVSAQLAALDRMEKPRAEVSLAAVGPVRSLVRAAKVQIR